MPHSVSNTICTPGGREARRRERAEREAADARQAAEAEAGRVREQQAAAAAVAEEVARLQVCVCGTACTARMQGRHNFPS